MENIEYDIQYRANKKYPNCLVKYPDDDIPFNERQSHIRMGYIEGATEQKQIDVDKACEAYCKSQCGKVTSGCQECGKYKVFRKTMEE